MDDAFGCGLGVSGDEGLIVGSEGESADAPFGTFEYQFRAGGFQIPDADVAIAAAGEEFAVEVPGERKNWLVRSFSLGSDRFSFCSHVENQDSIATAGG